MSSTIVLGVGQAGNQLATSFWSFMSHEQNARNDSMFHQCGQGSARSILIDSEPKVVQRAIKVLDGNAGVLPLRSDNIVYDVSGCGNNWAFGYTQTHSLLERSLDRFRSELECCDSYNGTLMLHSIAGGTGSGCGSHLIEEIRSLCPKNYITTVSIGPSIPPCCHALTQRHLRSFPLIACPSIPSQSRLNISSLSFSQVLKETPAVRTTIPSSL